MSAMDKFYQQAYSLISSEKPEKHLIFPKKILKSETDMGAMPLVKISSSQKVDRGRGQICYCYIWKLGPSRWN